MVPLAANRATRVLAITYARRTDLGAGAGFNAEMRRSLDSIRTEFVSSDDAAPDFSRLLSAADSVDVVVLGSYVNISSTTATTGAPGAFIDFVSKLQARHGAWFSSPSALHISCSRLRRCHPTSLHGRVSIAASDGARFAGVDRDQWAIADQSPPFARFGDGEQRAMARMN
jgi:hypothetical protein